MISFFLQGIFFFQNSTSLQWGTDRSDTLRDGGLSSPPPKRSRSQEDERNTDYSIDRDRSPLRSNEEAPDSLLGQALEGGPTSHTNIVSCLNF